MGRTRALVTLSGTQPVLVQPRPWHQDKHLAANIRSSLAQYGAAGDQTSTADRYDPRPDPNMRRQ
jgi:hypothetical protein